MLKYYSALNYFWYNILIFALSPFIVLYYLFRVMFTGKEKKGYLQRLGLRMPCSQNSCVWVHAVSMGEVLAAAPIVTELSKLFPSVPIVFSTVTDTGQKVARDKIKEARDFFYLPLDFPFLIRKFLSRLHPIALVVVETEFWPNLLSECRKSGVKIVLANGRVSEKSFQTYLKFRLFFKQVLSSFDFLAMQSELQASRVIAIGADPARVRIVGSTKYDSEVSISAPTQKEALAKTLGFLPQDILFVSGSTHSGEEELILSVFTELKKNIPSLRLVIAPRHPERFEEVWSLIQKSSFTSSRRTTFPVDGHRNSPDVFLLDTIGELSALYGLADIVFIGGSLVPTGGHNLLEAAAQGKLTFFGPHMENFREISESFVNAGAAVQVKNPHELIEKIQGIIKNGEEHKQLGEKAKELVIKNKGSARTTALLVKELLSGLS